MREVHVIYTDFGDQGWGMGSPQIPNLVSGRKSIDEALADTADLLEWCGFKPDDYVLHRHEEKYAVSPNGEEFFLRFAEDDESDARGEAIGRMLHSIENETPLADLERMPSFVTGEHLIISVLEDDRMGWILDQLGDREGAYLQFYAGEDALYGVPIYDTDQELGRGTTTLEKLGLGRESSVRDLIDAVTSQELDELRISIQHVPGVSTSA